MVEDIILVCILAFIVVIYNSIIDIEIILKEIKQYIHNYYYEKINYK